MVSRIQYLPLAKQAQIQGDVVIADGKIVSGHPLLIPAALEGLKILNLSESDKQVVYHFILIDPVPLTRTEIVKKGDAFDRVVLWLLRIKTERVLQIHDSVSNPNVPKNRIDAAKTPVEVWVYGAIPCLQVLNSLVASR
jgi:hypothetical protein